MFQFKINAKPQNWGTRISLHLSQHFLRVNHMNTNTNKCRFITKYKCIGHNYVEKIRCFPCKLTVSALKVSLKLKQVH